MQSNNKNFVFVVLDALRGDHINKRYMPFLHSLKSRSIFVKSLNVSSGFCERSEIFFGQCPRESGFVHAISPNSEIKPYSWLSARKARFLMIFELTPVLKKILRRVLWKLSISFGYGMYPQRIPLSLLRKFGLTEDSVNFEDYSIKIKKGLLFTIISRGFKVDWRFFTSLSSTNQLSDSKKLQDVPKYLAKSCNQFLPVYIGASDEYGHKFGPHSIGLVARLADIDKELEEFYLKCRNIDPDVTLCFVGDHGMEAVTKTIDLKKEITSMAFNLKVMEGVDYGVFFDSTSVRFWFYNKSVSVSSFIVAIKDNKLFCDFGRFLNDELCSYENLPPAAEIADLVWWAAKGIQVAPDYFNDDPKGKLGMHGYLRVDDISSGFVLCDSSQYTPVYFKDCECNELGKILF
ncbi:MAG: alkaline phosphatase family protein [Emcibacteraceae bacterium]|nr:alkaline phosphatase family protein [Emcibacteraceae bacterium]